MVQLEKLSDLWIKTKIITAKVNEIMDLLSEGNCGGKCLVLCHKVQLGVTKTKVSLHGFTQYGFILSVCVFGNSGILCVFPRLQQVVLKEYFDKSKYTQIHFHVQRHANLSTVITFVYVMQLSILKLQTK